MKYWRAITSDGNVYAEPGSTNWGEIESDVTELELHIGDQTISLPKNMKYTQAKTASADFNGKNVQIESRYIAFKLGNNIVRVRVDEKTNNISIEVE